MFKYTLQNEADQQVNVQAAARDQYTSPPATPLTPIQANSLVYHQLYQQCCINNRQYRQDSFQISAIFKRNKKAM